MNPQERDFSSAPTMPKSPAQRPVKSRMSFLKFLLLILSYVIVAAIVWKVSDQWKNDPAKQQAKADQQIRSTVDKVRKLMILPDPESELPQVAVVNDAAGLAKSQAFFADVKDGDEVLIYLKAQKAIVYRASENKIVNVGPVIADQSASAAKPQAPAAPSTSSSGTSTSTSR